MPQSQFGNAVKPAPKAENAKSQSTSKPRVNAHKQREIVQRLEQQIEALEARQAVIARELERPDTWSNGARSGDLKSELQQNADQLARLSPQWELEAERLQAIESA